MKNKTKNEVLWLLGIETENESRYDIDDLVAQYQELDNKYKQNEAQVICLKGDKVRFNGRVVGQTTDLYAIKL